MQRISQINRSRLEKYGNTIFHLEPNVKDGPGGLRDYQVGTDTGNYVRQFRLSESFSSVTERKTEIAYNLLSWGARWLSDSYSALLLLIAAIVVTCYVSTIVRLTRRYETALYLFVVFGIYTFFFNGARQGIAAAICFAALLPAGCAWPCVRLCGRRPFVPRPSCEKLSCRRLSVQRLPSSTCHASFLPCTLLPRELRARILAPLTTQNTRT